MVLYTFGNFYMSSIQQGIQAAHSVSSLFTKYTDPIEPQYRDLYDWANDYETIVCLNGGNLESLSSLVEFLDTYEESGDNNYAWSHFNESQQDLGGILTNVAIVADNELFDAIQQYRNYNSMYFNEETEEFQQELVRLIGSSPLAR